MRAHLLRGSDKGTLDGVVRLKVTGAAAKVPLLFSANRLNAPTTSPHWNDRIQHQYCTRYASTRLIPEAVVFPKAASAHRVVGFGQQLGDRS